MRQLIYFLVVANLGFFLWHALQGTALVEPEPVLPPLPAGVKPLVTLEEREAARAAELESITGSQPPGAGIVLSCHRLGPFYAAADMQAVAAQLHESGYTPEQVTSENRIRIGYWIYLPAMGVDKAQEVAELLDSEHDKEYFIGKDNVISLGAFKQRSRAEIRLATVHKYGLDPLLEPRYRTNTVYWLKIEGLDGKAEVLEAIKRQHPGVDMQIRVCE